MVFTSTLVRRKNSYWRADAHFTAVERERKKAEMKRSHAADAASSSSLAGLAELFEERRESRKFKEPVEKLLRPENIIIKRSNACDAKNAESITVLGHALQECGIENEIATYVKKRFDEKFGPGWQCVVGRNFGSHIDCVEFVHLSVSKISVLIFRCR